MRLSLSTLLLATWALSAAAPARAAKCPNLLIVLDKSGSMTDSPSGGSAPMGSRKWDLAVRAVKELLTRYDGQLPIGLSLFAGDGSCGAGKIDIAPDYDTAAAIKMRIDQASPDSATPTSETINNLRMQKVLQDPSRAQYLLLITDGEPICAANEPQATVDAIEAARKQSPSITTFVVGFGALPSSAANAMDRMADAGGKPVMGMARKFYQAESLEALNEALDDIFQVIIGEGVMGCDDTCYSPDVGCPTPGDLCIRAECRPNPCTGVDCGPGLYCYTDGVSPAECVKPCNKRCPSGQRCERGTCIPTTCPAPCIAGYVCDAESKRCVEDPLCKDLPRRQQCKSPSQCQFGTCVDEPCQFIRCPPMTRCVPWNGSCEFVGGTTGADMAPGEVEPEEPTQKRGCSTTPGAGSGAWGGVDGGAIGGAALVLLALLLRRRSAKNLPPPA